MNKKRLSLLSLALFSLSTQPTWGNEAADDDLSALLGLSLQELIDVPVVTASRQAETRDQTPAHITVITRQQIRERRYKNLADLLYDMPGVDFQRGTKTSQYNQFAVQGYVGPNKLLVMQDGVRIGHPGGGNFPIAENLALYQAKQVEILYGPAAALYGADAVSGVVNIITEAGNASDGSWFSAGGGRFDSAEGSFMGGFNLGDNVKLALGGHAQQSDRTPLDRHHPDYLKKVDGIFGSTTVLPAASREDYVGDISSHSLFARLDYKDDLTLGVYRYRFNSLTSTGDPMATAQYDVGAQWQTTTDTVYGKYRYALAPNLSGSLMANYSRMEVDPKAYYNNVYNAFTKGYSYIWGERLELENTLSWRLNDAHQMQAGIGWQKFNDIEAGSLPLPYRPGRSAGNQGQLHMNTDLPIHIDDVSFHNVSAYAQWQAQWTESISTTAGLRADKHSAYGSSTNPRLGAVWKASGNHIFKALYGEAFRAPSPEEKLTAYGMFDGTKDGDGRYIGENFQIPNHDLEPEKVRSISLVWDWRPRPNLNLISNLYHSRISNLVVGKTVADNDIHSIPGAILITPGIKGNAGRQKQTGLDVSAQWRYQLSGSWSGDLWSSASWIRGRVDEGDGVDWKIPYVAQHKLKLGTTLRYQERLSITPSIYWIGDTTNGRKKEPGSALLPPAHCSGSQTAPNRCTTPGYTLANLHVGLHKLLDGNASLWLDVYNLTDKRYYAAAGSGSLTYWDMPQQARLWMLSFSYRFK